MIYDVMYDILIDFMYDMMMYAMMNDGRASGSISIEAFTVAQNTNY
jgi:hypothetical protein